MCQVTTNTIDSINQDTADTQVIVTPTDDTYHYVISKSRTVYTFNCLEIVVRPTSKPRMLHKSNRMDTNIHIHDKR